MTQEQIDNIFTYHAPQGTQAERYVKLRSKAREYAILVNQLCPESREKSLGITAIQHSCQMANAAIAVNEKTLEPENKDT